MAQSDWNVDVKCFRDVANQLARLYMFQHPSLYLPAGEGGSSSEGVAEDEEEGTPITSAEGCQEIVDPPDGAAPSQGTKPVSLEWVVRNVFFPHCKTRMTPSASLANDGAITQV